MTRNKNPASVGADSELGGAGAHTTPETPGFGGEVSVAPPRPTPRWLLLLSAVLYTFAIAYMLVYAGDRWIVRVFAASLAAYGGYVCRALFRRGGARPT